MERKSTPYLVTMFVVSVMVSVKANYTLEIMVHGYRNPTHLSLGQALFRHGYCEGERELPCSPCDNSFQFCVREYTSALHDGCYLGYMESELVAEDDDDLTFSPGDDIGGLTNPLLFSGETWPVTIELLFTVYDLDGSVTVDTQSDLVDTILITPLISAVPSQNDPFTEVMTYSGNFSELDLSFRLTCMGNFYGLDCSAFCVDTNDTRGHYTCSSSGERVCLEGYQNSTTNCTECAPAEGCSPLGGYCTEPGECICKEGFEGDNCSVVTHPCYLEPCLNKGVCLNTSDDPLSYTCECAAGYKGQKCEETDECVPDRCIHGNCTDLHFSYTCECSDGYEGRHCEIDIDDCVSVTCGGHGLCVDGVGTFICDCEEGYSGELCKDVVINTGGHSSGNSTTIVAGVLGGLVATLILTLLLVVIKCLRMKRRQVGSMAHSDDRTEAVIFHTSSKDSYSSSIPTFTNNAYSHSVTNVETAPACYISPYSTVRSAQEHVYDTVDDSTVRSAQEHVYAIADDSTVQSSMHTDYTTKSPLYARVDGSTVPNSMCAGDDDSDGEYVINQSVYDDVQ